MAIRPLGDSAIALDSSVFLRLGSYDDIIDYLNVTHAAPIILPGQAIQEFWNNQLNVADSIATGIRKRFDALKQEVEKVDSSFQDYAAKFSDLLEEFRASYGYAYDAATIRRTVSLLDLLKSKSFTAFASRERFSPLVRTRKDTKTPPGFKDSGDGDFFVYIDMLKALSIARQQGRRFARVVLVSNDKKPDWSREGVPHPLLSAELSALFDVPFEIWDLPKLVREVSAIAQ